ncbi:MAG: PIN domain-containing protein [Treponema sp.]|jgi:predicted nucleic acid-binding protein|nr:PIN domain-containing protein [Treponema sp.]
MNALAVLIDTDVLLDFLVDRKPFTKYAKMIIQRSQEKAINAFIAAHSITNIFYILRKIYTVSERKQRLLDLCRSISIVEIGNELIINALADNDFSDIEDCLQAECAGTVNADYIITRNIDDYNHSLIPAILPENLLKKLKV